MGKRAAIALLGLSAIGLGLYRFRQPLIARALRLTPPRYAVTVRRNLRVPMPDGITLAADHYAPKARGSFPTVLVRTPYGRTTALMAMIMRSFAARGYHGIIQDVRGRFDSEGEFEPTVHEAEDGLATLEWIRQQPWFNGALGMWGQSYLGYVQWAVAARAPDFLKALAPSVTGSQLNSVTFPDGAFGLQTALSWVTVLHGSFARMALGVLESALGAKRGRGADDAYRTLPLAEADEAAVGRAVPFFREWLARDNLDQPYWQASDHRAEVSRVAIPVYLVGGWYDILLRELLADYAALAAAGRRPYLTIGPWFHIHPGHGVESLRGGLAWFDAHLKGERGRLWEPPVRIYVTGANEWRAYDAWPPPSREQRYYLGARRSLSLEMPEAGTSPDGYRYDPADPTPSVGGAMLLLGSGPRDNRALEARPDVLCYTTPVLPRDVEIIGTPRLELYARSSLAHTDFFGRLCDVHPDGRSINVCDGLLRVAPGKGEPQPDGSLRLIVELWPTAHRFLRGHRIRLQVSSGAHPRWNRNLGTGEPLATGTRIAVAEQTIYHDPAHPSAIVLPICGGGG